MLAGPPHCFRACPSGSQSRTPRTTRPRTDGTAPKVRRQARVLHLHLNHPRAFVEHGSGGPCLSRSARVSGRAVQGMRFVKAHFGGRAVMGCVFLLRCCRYLLLVSPFSRRRTWHRSRWATGCARSRAIANVDPMGRGHHQRPLQQRRKMERRFSPGLTAGFTAPNVA